MNDDVKQCLFGFLDTIEQDDRSLMNDFHEATKLVPHGSKEVVKRIGAFLHVLSVRHMATGAWKKYNGYPSITLPEIDLRQMTLNDALKNRRSLGSVAGGFTNKPITLQQLSSILGGSYGLTGAIEARKAGEPTQPLRAAASAGGLYPCEIYACVMNVDGLEQGIYHYDVEHHALEVLKKGDPTKDLFECLSGAAIWRNAAVMLVIGLVIDRTVSKYMDRGYRFAMNDCGALIQNLYLTSTAVDITACANGGFFDQKLGNYLKLDNLNEFPGICFALGNR